MDTAATRLHRSLLAEASNIGPLRALVRVFATDNGADDDLAWRIELAVGEALTNIVMHAYRFTGPGRMDMLVDVKPDGFGVAVSDTGHGFGPRPDSPGAGMGVRIMREVATRVAIQRNMADGRSGTLVLLYFDRPNGHAALN